MLTSDYRTLDTLAYIIYGFIILLLLYVMIAGREIKGARSWIELGPFGLQPAEFAKCATALALAKYLSSPWARADYWNTKLIAGALVAFPMALIVLQGDAGTALIFTAFGLALYRERIIPNWVMILGFLLAALFIITLAIPFNLIRYYLVIPIISIALLYILLQKRRSVWLILGTCIVAGMLILYIGAVSIIFEHLEPHQKNRIMVLLDEDIDPRGREERYNLHHSQIAIGSGGLLGKGFRQGTQTKFNYVPEQSTDFIFCTIGEEYGFLGSFLTIGLFTLLLYRLLLIAERQRDKFVRIYAYSVAGIIFLHFAINIAMTIGLFPVVGIPLPFLSYGGSSLWGFTILLFILIKLDSHRDQQMIRQ